MSSRPSASVIPPSCKDGIIDEAARTILLEIVGDPVAEQRCRLGVLAFGDSITHGGGELQWGVALQSWALWVARGLGLPYTSYALDGALVDDVVHGQIPAFERLSAHPGARYELGCLYIGVNDVRALDWEPERFETDFRHALACLRGCCDRVLALTAPLELGRPRVRSKVQELNAAIERAAAEHAALVLDLSGWGARNLVMADRVHPTAFGQIAIAERALDVLERDGMRGAVRPSTLIQYETTRWQRLRGDATYGYRYLKEGIRALALTAWLSLPRPRSRR
jgi:lysophospholipase L1-like esterase